MFVTKRWLEKRLKTHERDIENFVHRETAKQVKLFATWSETADRSIAKSAEELAESIDKWKKKFTKNYDDQVRGVREAYIDSVGENNKANHAHHKLIEGWLEQLKNHIMEKQ